MFKLFFLKNSELVKVQVICGYGKKPWRWDTMQFRKHQSRVNICIIRTCRKCYGSREEGIC